MGAKGGLQGWIEMGAKGGIPRMPKGKCKWGTPGTWPGDRPLAGSQRGVQRGDPDGHREGRGDPGYGRRVRRGVCKGGGDPGGLRGIPGVSEGCGGLREMRKQGPWAARRDAHRGVPGRCRGRARGRGRDRAGTPGRSGALRARSPAPSAEHAVTAPGRDRPRRGPARGTASPGARTRKVLPSGPGGKAGKVS